MGKSSKLNFVVTAALSQIGHFSSALSSDTKSVNHIYVLDFVIIFTASLTATSCQYTISGSNTSFRDNSFHSDEN